LGYYAHGDGGGGVYYYDSTDLDPLIMVVCYSLVDGNGGTLRVIIVAQQMA
jgi:hypothetical protein